MVSHDDEQRRWMEQWRYAAVALESARREELQRLSDQDAQAMIEDVLGLADELPAREGSSGLVEQQRPSTSAQHEPPPSRSG